MTHHDHLINKVVTPFTFALYRKLTALGLIEVRNDLMVEIALMENRLKDMCDHCKGTKDKNNG